MEAHAPQPAADLGRMLVEQYRTAANLNARIEVHRRLSVNPYGWTRWLFDRIAAAGPLVLELGCGSANVWRENLARVPAGWQVILTDRSAGMIAAAQRGLGPAADRFRFAVADAQEIPCGDGSVHTVIANHMLYHVADLDRALQEIRRVLRPGGRLFCSTIGRGHMRELSMWSQQFGLTAFGESNAQMAERFGLETGADRLARWFTAVTLHRYADALAVTAAEPLIAYLLSSLPADAVTAQSEQLAAFARFVSEACAARGALHITKASGLFEAVRA